MSVENAAKVIKFAAKHPSFKASFYSSPHDALIDHSKELCLDSDGLTNEEITNILDFTNDDYASFEKLVGKGQPNFSPDNRSSIAIG